jgi:hypothetical protein
MDLDKTIRDLHKELLRLNQVIGYLEETQRAAATLEPSQRGRKAMSTAERRAVSQRMTKWWAARRARSGPASGSKSG